MLLKSNWWRQHFLMKSLKKYQIPGNPHIFVFFTENTFLKTKILYHPQRKDWHKNLFYLEIINPLSATPTKWSKTVKQFVGNYQQIVWVCLTIWSGWRLHT